MVSLGHRITLCLPCMGPETMMPMGTTYIGVMKRFSLRSLLEWCAMVSHNRRVTNPDSQQLGQEVRALIGCFTKQVQSQAGVTASSSLLLIEQ